MKETFQILMEGLPKEKVSCVQEILQANGQQNEHFQKIKEDLTKFFNKEYCSHCAEHWADVTISQLVAEESQTRFRDNPAGYAQDVAKKNQQDYRLLDQLLKLFDSDCDKAVKRAQHLYRAIEKMFEGRSANDAQWSTKETFRRVTDLIERSYKTAQKIVINDIYDVTEQLAEEVFLEERRWKRFMLSLSSNKTEAKEKCSFLKTELNDFFKNKSFHNYLRWQKETLEFVAIKVDKEEEEKIPTSERIADTASYTLEVAAPEKLVQANEITKRALERLTLRLNVQEKDYLLLRNKVERYLDKSPDSLQLADQVLDRLAEKVDKEEEQQLLPEHRIRDLEDFVMGIARLALHENWRQRKELPESLEFSDQKDGNITSYIEIISFERYKVSEDKQLEKFLKCYENLKELQKDMLLRYYVHQPANFRLIEEQRENLRKEIEALIRIAEPSQNFTLQALRNRIHLIVTGLKGCVNDKK